MSGADVLKLCDVIRQTSYDIHTYLSPIIEIKKYILPVGK